MKERDLLVWTPEMVSNFWDYEAQFSDKYFSYEHGRPLVEEIKPYPKGASRVLDYGCGPGYLVENFLESGFKTAGMDSSVDSRQRVAQRFSSKANFLGAFTEEELTASFQRFDAVTIIEVIEHLYDPWLDDLTCRSMRPNVDGLTQVKQLRLEGERTTDQTAPNRPLIGNSL